VTRIQIDDQILKRAVEIAKREDILPPGKVDKSLSQKGRAAVWEGAVGQAVFERALENLGVGFEFVASIFYDYDTDRGTVEVKTKERAVDPRPEYEASVYDYNSQRQNAEHYAFVSLRLAPGHTKSSEPKLHRYDVGWVCGVISGDDLARKAKRVEIGDPLPNGQKAQFVSHNVTYAELSPLGEEVQ